MKPFFVTLLNFTAKKKQFRGNTVNRNLWIKQPLCCWKQFITLPKMYQHLISGKSNNCRYG